MAKIAFAIPARTNNLVGNGGRHELFDYDQYFDGKLWVVGPEDFPIDGEADGEAARTPKQIAQLVKGAMTRRGIDGVVAVRGADVYVSATKISTATKTSTTKTK